jgi:hypothetical protein
MPLVTRFLFVANNLKVQKIVIDYQNQDILNKLEQMQLNLEELLFHY